MVGRAKSCAAPSASMRLTMWRSIAVGCRLDQIASSAFQAAPPPTSNIIRSHPSFLAPPTSQIELGERIYALYARNLWNSALNARCSWAIFVVDRCGSIVLEWAAAFDVRCILTPLPRSWAEYEKVRQLCSPLVTRLTPGASPTNTSTGATSGWRM